MESDEVGSQEELNMRPDKQPETHEGDPTGKREEGYCLKGPMCLGSMRYKTKLRNL